MTSTVSAFELEFRWVAGQLTAVHQSGPVAAPALLLLHGLGAAGSTYQPVVERLGATYRLIVPDLLGSGRTAKPLVDYRPDQMADHLRALLAVLGLDRLRGVVGHSQGAAVAVELCHQLPPGAVERLALLDPPPVDGLRWLRPFTRLTRGGRSAELLSALLPHRRLAKLWLGFLYADRRRLRGEVLSTYAAAAGERGYATATARALHSLARLKLPLEAAPPTLLLWGARDRLFPPRLARGWQARLATSELQVLPATGHCPHEERPEAVALALGDFFSSAGLRQSA